MTMSVEQVLQTMEALGSEQARKTYRRHGVKGPQFGVSYADQKKLAKKIKTDHRLAVALWASGNHDARILALMVADPAQASTALLDSWLADLSDYVLTDALSAYAAKTTIAREKMDDWQRSAHDWISTVGWNVLSARAADDPALPDSYFEPYIATIERAIHGSQNRTRHAMNSALIAIGARNAALEAKAVSSAKRIGKVSVDHGDTNCTTPDAIGYIKKIKDRKADKIS